MTIRIKLAQTTAELDDLFRTRHRVFVEEMRYMPGTHDGRILDRFDAFPTTANVVALFDGRVVGGLRLVEPSEAGAPADEYFDFRPYLPPGATRVGSGSMLLLDPEYRNTPRLTFAMLGMGYYWAVSRNLTHLTGAAAPEAEELFTGAGYKPVAPRFFHEPTHLHVTPVILDVSELNDRFLSFINQHQAQYFLDSFERQFHQPGEKIISMGEEGHAAYIVVGGRVAVTVDAAGQDGGDGEARVVAELGPGEIFGELALLTARPRSANIVALTEVDLIVLEREAFQAQLTKRPEVALNLLKILGNRLASTVERFTK